MPAPEVAAPDRAPATSPGSPGETAQAGPSRETLNCCFGINRSFNHHVAVLNGNNVASDTNVQVLR